MMKGIIFKALSGFYYVDDGTQVTECRGRGKFRYQNISPLVGDWVEFTPLGDGKGTLETVLPRKNQFYRPSVANIDQLVLVVSEATPVTDPFLVDRVITIAEGHQCDSILCINKCDLACGDKLAGIYQKAGFQTVKVSAKTGEGIAQLETLLRGKVSAFTGNSGVGKSSILNALAPGFSIPTGEVSQKLGRGRHTTRHVELFRLPCDAVVADTPGFSSFEVEKEELCRKEHLAERFREFAPYRTTCQFLDCAHGKEKGCAVREAVQAGHIPASRYESYLRLYDQAKQIPDWER